MNERDVLYLEHIVDAIDRIREYTRDGRDAFLRDAKTQDAVLRRLEVVGEAVKNLNDGLSSGCGQPWNRIFSRSQRPRASSCEKRGGSIALP
jgi:uncharacterized protein with HEPN domain